MLEVATFNGIGSYAPANTKAASQTVSEAPLNEVNAELSKIALLGTGVLIGMVLFLTLFFFGTNCAELVANHLRVIPNISNIAAGLVIFYSLGSIPVMVHVSKNDSAPAFFSVLCAVATINGILFFIANIQ